MPLFIRDEQAAENFFMNNYSRMKSSSNPVLFLFLLFCAVAPGCRDNKSAPNSPAPENRPSNSAGNTGNSAIPPGAVDFVAASKASMPAVVHIKVHFNPQQAYSEVYGLPPGYPSGGNPVMASGSGVIISTDGYIATNNHVVENASQIDVILPDKRTFSAKLVGRDPNTDLALIKVEGQNLPVLAFGNSDDVQVGQWVLAVGFPLSLNTTVTVGIVSAKARSIGIINRPSANQSVTGAGPAGNAAVESFIQTDAAINPGNSGGALVTTDGKLVGINSAIASQTGSYAGYAFAIPANLAKKILDDLKNYGAVKRGVLGVSFPAPAAEDRYLAQQGLDPASVKGVYITGVQDGSAAASAGLKEGDVIQSIDGIALASSTEFSERVARHKPGDAVKLSYLRSGKEATVTATLKGEEAASAVAKAGELEAIYDRLGASFVPLSAAARQQFNLQAGVVVTDIRRGGFFDQAGIPPGTIIAFVNGQPVNNPNEVNRALSSAQQGRVRMLAIAPDGSKVVFDFSLGT